MALEQFHNIFRAVVCSTILPISVGIFYFTKAIQPSGFLFIFILSRIRIGAGE